MSAVDHDLVTAVRRGLAELADPVKAPQMQRYMRSAMPFRGVPTPVWRPMVKRLARKHPFADAAALIATVHELWHRAGYREERYVSIELTAGKRWQLIELLPLYEELIIDGAWWDYVDQLAIQRVGPLLHRFPDDLTPVVRSWATRTSPWLRRSAVICQVAAKRSTNTDLLAYCVEANLDDPDFFLRKGIGWALREYGKTDPRWVAAFVAAHPSLSALSRREATRRLPVTT